MYKVRAQTNLLCSISCHCSTRLTPEDIVLENHTVELTNKQPHNVSCLCFVSIFSQLPWTACNICMVGGIP